MYTSIFDKEKFTEMSRIGNLPIHDKISIWVNERGEDRQDPHFHMRLANNKEHRISFKDLKSLDEKSLSKEMKKEIKKWFLSKRKSLPISNLDFSLEVWNSQEGHKQKISKTEIAWKQ